MQAFLQELPQNQVSLCIVHILFLCSHNAPGFCRPHC
nr:MAG TPA: hypothetical protein [Bacteriophage sp.]